MKKLTLSARESTIETAKRLAEESGTSVSAMFERLILLLESQKKLPNATAGPATRKATGLIEISGDANGRDVLQEALLDKYGKAP
jgi:hypothetical protein